MVSLEYVGKHQPQGLYIVKAGLVEEHLKSGEWQEPGFKKESINIKKKVIKSAVALDNKEE